MSIEKLKSGKFRVRIWQKGVTVANSPTFDKKSEATAWEIEYKNRALHQDLGLQFEKVSILEPLALFADKLKDFSLQHRQEKLRVVGMFIDQNRLKLVSDFKGSLIPKFVNGFKLSPWTKTRFTGYLKHFAKFLNEEDFTIEDVSKKVKKPRSRTLFEKRALTLLELESVLGAVKSGCPDMFNICYFLALTGCRKGEAVLMEWSDFDFERRLLSVQDKPNFSLRNQPFRCKGGSARTIPMSNELIEHLRSIPRESNFVFVENGISPNTFYHRLGRKFRSAVNEADVERPHEVTIHSFRHTWITHALTNGLDINKVRAYAGHRNISTTAIYLHLIGSVQEMEVDTKSFVKTHFHLTSTRGKATG